MHQETVILVQVLEELRSRRIVALGLHDGLMVARSRANEVKTVMEEVARELTSVHLRVEMKE
jgi:hypothetical protein